MTSRGRGVLALGLSLALSLGLHACSPGEPAELPLNSERIAQVFGSYGVDVLHADTSLRVSSLYSTEDGVRTTRTLAVVGFPGAVDARLAAAHAEILDGASIGASLQAAGWTVEKRNLYFGVLPAPAAVSAAMRIAPGTTLAVHGYALSVGRDDLQIHYATIAELHHPDYLDLAALRSIYGDVLTADADAGADVGRFVDRGLAVLATGVAGAEE